MKVLAGTSGFAFPEWKGVFYPQELKAAVRILMATIRKGCT